MIFNTDAPRALIQFVLLICTLALSACAEHVDVSNNQKAKTSESNQKYDGLLVKLPNENNLFQLDKSSGFSRMHVTKAYDSLLPGLKHVSIEDYEDPEQAIANLKAAYPEIEFIEKNYLLEPSLLANDEHFKLQWSLSNLGQSGGTSGADINISEAWDRQSTSTNVVLALIDSGVDITHEDLRNNIWRNLNEIPGNHIDDDKNGYIDDVQGWDFVENDNQPTDDFDHGTHLAGIIAATGNNQTGVSGINWRARIMPLKIVNQQGKASVASAIEAIQYAIRMGANISNISWGAYAYSEALYRAMRAAAEKNHLFITAAGNQSFNNDTRTADAVHAFYPSSYNLPNIISVAASNDQDNLASFSNYGVTSVDLAAPGAFVYSSLNNDHYGYRSGTSVAAAHVSGIALLMHAYRPQISYLDLRQALISAVDIKHNLIPLVGSGGRVNAFKALNALHKMTDLGSMAITAAQSSIIVGQEIQLQLSEEADQGMWHVTSDIAQVDESSGWLKALKPGEVEIFYVNQNKQSLAQSLTLVIENLSIVPSVAPELNFLDELHFSSNGGVSPLTWTLESGSEIVSLRSGDIETEIDVLSGEVNGEYVLSVSDALGNQAKVGPFSVVEQLLSVSPTTYELGLQEAQALNILGGVKPYSISISDEAIVSMSQNQVRGIALGETRIIITDARGKSVSLEISVINKPLTISHSQLDLSYPQTETVAAFGGTPPYVWSSNNEAIATVSAIGEVSTQGAGSTVITLSDSSQPNVSITLNTQVIVPPLEIINANGILWVGNGNKLQVEARGGIPPYVWSSEDTDLISINQDGLLTVLATQLDSVESKVSVLLSDSGSTRSHSADFIIRQIAIDQLPTSIAVGEQLTLNGRGFGELAWSLSDNDLASIDPQSVFTALDVGMLSIILQDELANQTQHEIEVTAIPVLIQTTASNELFIGDEIVLNGQGEGDLLWLSSDEMILQKSGSQNNEVSFKAIAAGSVRILLTDARQAQTAVFDVVVHANRLSGLPAHVEKSQLVQLQAVGKPPMIWSLTNDSVARLEVDELGQHALLTALTAGQTQIQISDANGNQVSSPLIDVQPIPVSMKLPLTQIFVVGEVIHLSATGDGELNWSVTPSQGEFTNQDSTSVDFTPSNTGDIVLTVTDAVGTSASSESRTVYQPIVINTIINSMQAGERVFIFAQGNGRLLWRVSDTSKAYINANTGELLALHAGEIRVIISDEFGVSVASDLITINEAVTVINTAISTMTIGQSQQFTGSGNGNLSWSVSNTNVASIDASSGLLNAIAAGEVEVILTDAIGNLVRSSPIQVLAAELAISVPKTQLKVGRNMQITASGEPPFQWDVSNNERASIDQNGVLSALSTGQIRVIVKDSLDRETISEEITLYRDSEDDDD